MGNLFVYDLNEYLKADAQMQNLMKDENFNIFPATAYDDESAPLIIWTWRPNIIGPELPFWRVDEVCYHVYDTDADNCLQIGERIISILSVSDKINQIPSYHSGKWCFLRRANFVGPRERDGWYQYIIDFEASHLPT